MMLSRKTRRSARHAGAGACFFLGALALLSCSDGELICDAVEAHPVDIETMCLSGETRATGVLACREVTGKGVTPVCLVSPEGQIHLATMNTHASLSEGDGWTYGESLSTAHRTDCDRAIEALGFEQPGPACG